MLIFLSCLISSLFALEIPKGLEMGEQQRVLEILGLGTSSKFLSNAYPLGGYSGLEVSLAFESIKTSEIAQLGTTTNASSNILFPTITVGKGVYNDSDLFIHFMPPSKTLEISKFGTSYRWGFYQALFLPLSFSLVLHADITTIKSQISTRNLGGDLLVGMSLSQFSFFLGSGFANSSGDFQGGTSGITASSRTESQRVESSHFMFGATYNFEPFFVGASLDRYTDNVYSIKSGFLF